VPSTQPGAIQFLPTIERIVYGAGACASLGAEIQRLGARRVMLVTHRALAASASVSQISAQIGAAHAGTFAAPLEHVPMEQVAAATQEAARLGADLIVAVGGGGAIDAAKALRVCIAAGPRSAAQLRAFMENPRHLAASTIPQVSIPTTLAGAEYTRSFSATDLGTGVKLSYTDSSTAGRIIIYDPDLTRETPIPLWLGSGVTALSHALEVLCVSPPHPVGDTRNLRRPASFSMPCPRPSNRRATHRRGSDARSLPGCATIHRCAHSHCTPRRSRCPAMRSPTSYADFAAFRTTWWPA
jgi:maleylacetate reductase